MELSNGFAIQRAMPSKRNTYVPNLVSLKMRKKFKGEKKTLFFPRLYTSEL